MVKSPIMREVMVKLAIHVLLLKTTVNPTVIITVGFISVFSVQVRP